MSALPSTRLAVSSSSSSPARRLGFVELADLKLQQVETRRFLALVHLKRIELGLESLPMAKGMTHLLACCSQPRKLVEQQQVALRIEQRLVLVLAVELDERRGLRRRARRR